MENGPFIGDLPIQTVIFHSYVKLPEGREVWVWKRKHLEISHKMIAFKGKYIMLYWKYGTYDL